MAGERERRGWGGAGCRRGGENERVVAVAGGRHGWAMMVMATIGKWWCVGQGKGGTSSEGNLLGHDSLPQRGKTNISTIAAKHFKGGYRM